MATLPAYTNPAAKPPAFTPKAPVDIMKSSANRGVKQARTPTDNMKVPFDPSKLGALQKSAQDSVIRFCVAALGRQKKFTDLNNKFDKIDIAYARYTAAKNTSDFDANGKDISAAGNTGCNVFAEDDVTPPVVVSQVDSYVAYLAEIFCTGAPLFPVVSSPAERIWAEQLEALIDDHALLGGYTREILLFLRDGIKYNFSALEADWDEIDQFTVLDDVLASASQKKMSRTPKKFTKLKRLNPRNVIWDYDVQPGDVARDGDYAGYVERISKTKLKRLLNKWNAQNKAYNIDKAMGVGSLTTSAEGPNFVRDPQISNYVSNQPNSGTGVDWESWFSAGTNRSSGVPHGNMYEIMRIYARIMPSDFGISAPQPNTPQIWKFVVINSQVMVYAERVISAYDYLPILFGQPLEDGLGYQTQSVAEGEIPFQEAARTLFNIRFAAARRAVSDRALYLPDMINPSDINSAVPAPKIPVNISQLSNKKLEDAYFQIPFDMRGTETTIQDASTIVSFSKELHGLNSPRQGQFQKGNKSVQEWNDTMGGSDGRMRIPAIILENQVFSPLKSILALNIFQYGDDAVVISQATGTSHDIDIAKLRQKVLSFKMADGYTPKSKLASTDVLTAGMTMITQSPILQQAFGSYLPGIFVHFMSLSGVKGFDQYDPQKMAQAAQGGSGLPQQNLEQPGQPGSAAATPPQAGAPVLDNNATPGSPTLPIN